MASIKDVAKQAGVGVGTVSRVLNNTGYVAETTRKKIIEVMEQLDYTPNELARNLYHNKSGIIGLIVPNVDHPFYSSFCRAVEMELYQLGFKTMLCNTIEISYREQEFLNMLEQNVVDGIITVAHSLDIESYKKINRPIVTLDRELGMNIPTIGSDHEYGGKLAADLLVQNGCRNVIAITEAEIHSIRSDDRLICFQKILEENHVDLMILQTEWNNFEFDYFYEQMRKYLYAYPDIDGLFVSDIGAVSSLKILQEMGRRVPEDVKIIGYDATYITRMTLPVITAVRQDVDVLAKGCVNTLLQIISGEKNIPRRLVFNVDMQIGGTTL